MKLEGLMARFILAADPAEAVRLFAQHAELRDQRLRVFLQTYLAKARAENNQDADVLLTNRAVLLARLHKAVGETPGEPDEQGLRSHPLVQEFFERQVKAAALREEIARLLKYARSAQVRFDRSKDPADLREAVASLDELIAHDDFAGTPAEFRVEVFDNSANLALASFVATNERKDLDHAMARLESLLSLLPLDSDERATRGRECSLTLLDACREGRTEDLEAVSEWQRLMLEPAGSGPFAEALKAFGDRSRRLFTRSEALAFLEMAVESHREALQRIPAEHPERSEYLDTLAIDCKALFDVTSKPEWLDEAIPAWEEAVDVGERTPTIPRDYVPRGVPNRGRRIRATPPGRSTLTRWPRRHPRCQMGLPQSERERGAPRAGTSAKKPRRSRKVDHFCSRKVTHTRNTIWARSLQRA